MHESLGEHPLWTLPFIGTVHSDTVIVTWAVMAVTLITLGLMSVTRTGIVVNKRYTVMELVVTSIGDTATTMLGKAGLAFTPFLIALFIFILLLNEVGFIPFARLSPTSDLNTTAALAVLAFVLIQAIGIKNHGLKYYRHIFVWDPWYLVFFLGPIEIITQIARPVTLALRLFGNILAGEVLMLVVGVIIGAHVVVGWLPVSALANAGPLFIDLFNLFVGGIQAFVFTLLTTAYLIDATAETAH